jgi:hypothetical protein
LHTADGTVVPSNPAPLGNQVDYFDQFGVHNQYYVPQIGLRSELLFKSWFCQASGKIGLGLLHMASKMDGTTVQQFADGSLMQTSSGVLAMGPGTTSQNRFVFLPEFTLAGGYQFTSWCCISVGYNLLFASEVVRAGSLVGPVDPRQVPQLAGYDPTSSTANLASRMHESSFWVQGFTAGLEFRY